MDKIVIHLDASILKNFNCFRFYYRKAILGKSLTSRSNYKQAFGTAVHKFLQSFYTGLDFGICLEHAKTYYMDYAEEVPPDDVKEFRYMHNLQKVCFEYAKNHKRVKNSGGLWLPQDGDFLPFWNDGKPSLETKFSIPIFENDKYVLYLSGTIDMVCKYGGHPIVLVDHKTTASVWKSQFIENFEFDIQVKLYSKVFKELNGLDYYPPIAINCFFLKKPTQKAEKIGVFDGCDYVVSPIISFIEEEMVEFNDWLGRKISEIVAHLNEDCKNAEEDFNYAACKQFGNCEYTKVCKAPKNMHQTILDNEFVLHQYNPLKFQD